MNFVSKFDGGLSFTGTHPKTQTHADTVHTKAPADAIIVKDANLLFNGDFKRSGTDLVISKDDHELVFADYFKGEKRAPLASPDGAYLTGKIVDTLTGHVQTAQADGSASAAKIIGHVTKLTGTATATRNGVSIILNNGDNVYQGDVVQSGSNSTLGITFIDGSVFGLASNARMVLNEMVYDPNGSNNSSLLSLVQGTISFVAGATAKHGDMKVDTPVATMGIRGTAVLAEIEFEVLVPGVAPPVRFQVLVEPDGTTGSYVLLDRVTQAPLATVSQAGTVTTVSGQGTVSFLASAQLSPEVMKLISEVFSQRYSDNSNPKSDTHFTDSIVPETTFAFKVANGDPAIGIIHVTLVSEGAPSTPPPLPPTNGHIPGPPKVTPDPLGATLAERTLLTGSSLIDTTTGKIYFEDVNAGDSPTARTQFTSFSYKDAQGANVTATLTAAQLAAIANSSIALTIVQDPTGKNIGAATWTYNIDDAKLDYLAEGEKLTLTYTAFVDNNFAPNNETGIATFTITITGTNDVPTITGSAQAASITEQPDTVDSSALDTATGTIEFRDVDLTDTHTVSITGVTADGTVTGLPASLFDLSWLSLGAFTDSTDGITGSRVWSFSAEDHYFDYLAEDETVTLTYTVEVEDNNGATVTQDVVVTVTGTNDAPELAIDTSGVAGLHAITELEDVTGSTDSDTAAGSLTFRDVDLSDTHTVSNSGPAFVWLDANGDPLPLTLSQTSVLTGASTFTLTPYDSTGTGNGSIDFSYGAADHYFDFLAENETLTITYEVTVTDEHNVTSTRPVTVTVTGTNDVPVAVADTDSGTVVESGHDASNTVVPGNADTGGNVLANDTDVDLTDTHEVIGVVAGTAVGDVSGDVGETIVGTYGDLVLNADGTWTYHLRNDYPATDALAEGAPASDVFSYTQTDHHGGTSTTTLTINITGTNDEPVTNAAPVAATDVNEGTPVVEQGVNPGNDAFAGVDSATGNVLDNDYDVDTGDTKTVQSVTHGATSSPVAGPTGTQIAGTYGTLTIFADGTWSYALDNDSEATQALSQGESAADVFTYTMHDTLGSTSSATLSIAVTGTNDVPVAVADTDSGTVVESGHDASNTVVPGNADTGGNVLANDTDVDLTDTHEVIGVVAGTAVGDVSGDVGETIVGTYGDLVLNADGTWTYHLRNDYPATDALAEGESAADVFSYTESDNHGATSTTTLTINITGTNDEPVANGGPPVALADVNAGDPVVEQGVNPGNTAEPGLAAANGNVLDNDYDVDTGDTRTVQSVTHGATSSPVAGPTGTQIAGTYGTLTIFADGTWSYALDNDSEATQALSQDESAADVFTYTMHDTLGSTSSATLSIAVTGTNDAPTVAAVDAGTLTDTAANDGFSDLTGTLAGDDLDSGATLSYAALDAGDPVNTAVAGLYGSLTVGTDGSYVYVPNAAAINALAAGSYSDTFTVQTTDEHGATGTATLTVNVTGANDAPTVAAVDAGTLTDTAANDGFSDLTGTLAGDDLDSGATLSYAALDAGDPVNTAVAGLYGSLTVGTDGNYVYVPNAAAINALASGSYSDTFTVQTTDEHGATGTATLTVNVTGSNDDPAVTSNGGDETAGISVDENTTAVTTVQATDVDTATVTYSLVTGVGSPDELKFAIDPDTGALSFVAPPDFETPGSAAGTNVYTVQVQASDGAGGTDIQTLTVTVGDVGEVLQANADTVDTDEDTAITLSTLTANDLTTGGTPTVVSVGNAVHGTVTLNGGSPVFTPEAGFSGQASFTYWITEAANPAPAGTFQAPLSSATGSGPQAVATTDLDDDGDLDLVVTNNTGVSLSVLLGNGDGTFGPQTTYATGVHPFAVALDDIDGDNDVDIVVANLGSNSISVLLGDGTGSFAAQQTYATGTTHPQAVQLGDFNGDGKLDVVTSGASGNAISLLLGNGDGTFGTASTFATAGYATGVEIGDFNGDGKLDVVSSNYNTDTVSVLLGDGLGGFSPYSSVSVGDYTIGVVVGDFNGDGKLDFATANNSSNNISVLIGNGDGTFQTQVNYATGTGPAHIAAEDFDQDGKLDLVVADGSSTVSVFRGIGDGTFAAAVAYSAATTPGRIATGDYNGDGLVDIAVADSASDTVNVLLNGPAGETLSSATVTVNVTPSLLAVNDTVVTSEDAAITLSTLTANDLMAGGGTPTIVSVYNAQHGTVALNNGVPVFTPDPDFTGEASFSYSISDAASPTAPGTFNAAVNYAINASAAFSVALGDFNNDGKLDAVTANYSSNNVSLFAGNGDGTFQTSTVLGAGGSGAYDVTFGDFNGDGNQDLVVANSASNNVGILLGNGDGTFAAATTVAVGSSPEAVAVGDVDHDGNADIVVANHSSNSVSVLLGNGTGGFSTTTYSGIASPFHVTLADVNGDGSLDILSSNYGASSINIALNNGNGTFAAGSSVAVGAAPAAIAAGDFNGDGKIDLAVSNSNDGTVSILLGDGNGAFASQVTYAVGSQPLGVQALDVDQDGKLDLIVGNAISNTVSMLLGNGDGTFGAATTSSVGQGPQLVAAGDLDGDGRVDFVTSNAGTNDISVLRNASPGGALSSATVTVNVASVNDAPAFAGTDLLAAYFASGSPIAIVSSVSASDIDSDNYAGGTLTATVTAGGNEGDTLTIEGNDYIALSGTTVMYDADGSGPGGSVAIGTLTNYDYNSLTVTLNGDADDEAVVKLAQAIEFSNSKPDPVAGERTVTFTLHDGGGIANGGQDSAFFTTTVTVTEPSLAGPVINTTQFEVNENGDESTVTGLYVTDTDPTASTDTFQIVASAVSGSVALPDDEGLLTEINSALLTTGVTYDPGVPAPNTDVVTFTVTDGFGNSDTVNFIFNEAGTGPTVTLTGTAGKDVIFATGYDDTLTGGASADQFVFTPEGGPPSFDTITDFNPNEDHIDLREFASVVDEGNFAIWFNANVTQSTTDPDDVVITVGSSETITLKDVALANLSASDFILAQSLGN